MPSSAMQRSDSMTIGLGASRVRSVISTRIDRTLDSGAVHGGADALDERGVLQGARRHVGRDGLALEIGFGRPRGELPQTQLEHPRIELDDQAGLLGHVDEGVGGTTSPLGNTMRARDSTERICPVAMSMSGWKNGASMPGGERAAQQALRLEARVDAQTEGVVEQRVLVASGVLRPVERQIGLAEQVHVRAIGVVATETPMLTVTTSESVVSSMTYGRRSVSRSRAAIR